MSVTITVNQHQRDVEKHNKLTDDVVRNQQPIPIVEW